MAAAEGAISAASEIWGGKGFLIVPTDGNRIREKFWDILAVYDPDHMAVYGLTLKDMQTAQPEKYESIKQGHREQREALGWTSDQFEGWFNGSAEISLVDELTLSEELESQLLGRLNPFYFQGRVVQQYISRSVGFRFPFTKITEVVPLADARAEQVCKFNTIEDPIASLIVKSQTGDGSEKYFAELESKGASVAALPNEFDPVRVLEHIYDRSREVRARIGDSYQSLSEFVGNAPFGISMAHLGQYYRLGVHLPHKEPVTVVIGDSVDDFCLYYCMSHIHENVCWLPLKWLRGAYKAHSANLRRYERGQAPEPNGFEQRVVYNLVNRFFDLAEHGTGEKYLQICSMSLRANQVAAYKGQMATLAMVGHDPFSSSARTVPIDKVSVSCSFAVFEEDNYTNNEPAVFVDGQSVSPFPTPQPRSFSKVPPTGLYWIVSLSIERYQPPKVNYLAAKIVQMTGFPVDVRVASDGIAYHCPNVAYFGGGINANLVRPRLRLIDEMELLGDYFGPTGISIRYSDKGNYFQDTLRRFGGLDETADFIRSGRTRRILDAFMSSTGKEDGSVVYLSNDQRSYLSLKAFEDCLGNLAAAVDSVDDLVSKEVLERGYILQCSRCRLASWYSIDVLTSEFVCSRCGFMQKYTKAHWKMPEEPRWYYKLAETIYQFYLNNSHVTVQALHKIKSYSKQSFLFVPEIDLLNFPDAEGKRREMDIACILDGGVIVGECKTEHLRPKDTSKFATLIQRLPHPLSKVVFATNHAAVSAEFRTASDSLGISEIFVLSDLYQA
jgi:hypothetical protein